ncbi:hypothetical protein GCM10009665_25580 [Kitasatospora nipponensis]|uniref:Trk K+ transport system NAD-binding subunit n=1 Tax=Kitasatospora nipponensis TaxID=258049 RepID=A0ABN1W3S1_9ACTN
MTGRRQGSLQTDERADDVEEHPDPAGEALGIAGHYIVCGASALAYELVIELVRRYDVSVVAIVPDPERDHAPRIAQLPRVVAVLRYGAVTDEALTAARIEDAAGVAMVGHSDEENFAAATVASRIQPRIRIVLRLDDPHLGRLARQLSNSCTVLSDADLAASRMARRVLELPQEVEVEGRILTVDVRAYDDDGRDVLAVLADRIDDEDRLRLFPLPPAHASEFIWLARRFSADEHEVPGRHADTRALVLVSFPTDRIHGIPLRVRLRLVLWRWVGVVGRGRPQLTVLVALLAILLGTVAALDGLAGRVIGGVAFAAGGLLLSRALGRYSRGDRGTEVTAGLRDHVIVVGLGRLGGRVAAQLQRIGVRVVGIEPDPAASGIEEARALGIPVLVGPMPFDTQLGQARISRSRSVVALTGTSEGDWEVALKVRELGQYQRIVTGHPVPEVWLSGQTRVASGTIAFLSAPVFAAALVGNPVLGTFTVMGRPLLVVEIGASGHLALAGRTPREIEEPNDARIIALRSRRAETVLRWGYSDRDRRLEDGDRVMVVATPAGLTRLTQKGQAHIPSDPAENQDSAPPTEGAWHRICSAGKPFGVALTAAAALWLALGVLPSGVPWQAGVLSALGIATAVALAVRPLPRRAASPSFEQRLAEAYRGLGPPPGPGSGPTRHNSSDNSGPERQSQ